MMDIITIIINTAIMIPKVMPVLNIPATAVHDKKNMGNRKKAVGNKFFMIT
jgi:hypothetical protein